MDGESDLADELANLKAERSALAERLRQHSDMRGIVGALRRLKQLLDADTFASRETASRQLNDLLRQLDESE